MKIDTIKVEKTVEVEEKAVTLSEQEARDISQMLAISVNTIGSHKVLSQCPDAWGTLHDMLVISEELDS